MIARLLAFLWGYLFPWRPSKIQAPPDFIRLNREQRRNVMRAQRLKGPGYTRAYRKGRTQRERP